MNTDIREASQENEARDSADIKITDSSGKTITLRPRIELYPNVDAMGVEIPGLAIELDKVDGTSGHMEPYASLTVNLGDLSGIPNRAYIDTNNCPFADQLLAQGIAEPTNFSRTDGPYTYPIWVFKEEFLQRIGGENYQKYAQAHAEYDPFRTFYEDAEPDMAEDGLTESQNYEEEQTGAFCPEMGGMV